MLSVSFPKKPIFETIDDKSGRFVIEGCYPGYGTTLGNSIRRALLSSLPGCAIVSVKIKGATHEFTTLKGVKEDMVQLILNLKKVTFNLEGVDEATTFLKVKGEKEVLAGDFETSAQIEVIDPEQKIATLTSSSSELEMEVRIKRGLGYVPVDQQENEDKEIGTIAIDAVYTPIIRANFNVENTRVGKRTDFDRITLEVFTDGSIAPQEAYQQAVEILQAQFKSISQLEEETSLEEGAEEEKVVKAEVESESSEDRVDPEKTTLDQLSLSTRTANVLRDNNIENIAQIIQMTEEELHDLEGMGEKGIKEIRQGIGRFGLTLKQ
jgi:DNA-directed RNA polymerase subunit alpha